MLPDIESLDSRHAQPRPTPPNDQNGRFFFILADLEKCTVRDP